MTPAQASRSPDEDLRSLTVVARQVIDRDRAA
jgi:hypothetical protein